jgi:peroxiredoxin
MGKLFLRLTTLYLLFMNVSIAQTKTGIVNDFSLKNVDGRYVSLKDYRDAKGFIIVFTCNHCPFAKLYPPRLNEINAQYKKLGVPLIAISSTDTVIYDADSYLKMVKKARDEKYNYPYLFDDTQNVAREFNAQKTPQAFVLWKENGKWVVKYNGGIDDNGSHPELVKHHFVTDAVDALLAGKEVAVKETKSIGCKINMR